MAVAISNANANYNGAATWASVDTGSNASQTTKSASTNTTGSMVYSATFTATNQLDGVLLYCQQLTTTGTVSVEFNDGTTAQRTVTVNASDLPVQPSYVFFKFGSNYTPSGANNKIGVSASSAGNARFWRNATAGNWFRHCRRTAAITLTAATDSPIIVGELTGAGTGNDITVTMNITSTASTWVAPEIGQRGILANGTAASTNYAWKLAGPIQIWGAGKWTIGDTGTRMPTSSTVDIEVVQASDGALNWLLNSGGTFMTRGMVVTSSGVKLAADVAAAGTGLTLSTTPTGWKNTHTLGFASTTRTSSESETKALTADVTTTSATIAAITNAHSGTSPTQGEVINLTRNIRLHGTDATHNALQIDPTFSSAGSGTGTTIDCEYTEFYFFRSVLASSTAMSTTPTQSIAFTGCSFRDITQAAFSFSSTDNTSLTLATCTGYNVTGSFISFASTGATTRSVTDCTAIKCGSAQAFDIGTAAQSYENLTLTGCTAAGGPGQGFNMRRTSGSGTGHPTLSSLTAHSNADYGFLIGNSNGDTFTSLTAWRNNTSGIAFTGTIASILFDTITTFGNASSGIRNDAATTICNTVFKSWTDNGGVTLTQPIGLNLTTGRWLRCFFLNASLGATTTHATGDVECATSGVFADIVFIASTFGSSTEFSNATGLLPGSRIGSQKHDNTTLTAKAVKREGVLSYDSTFGTSSQPSTRMTPAIAAEKVKTDEKVYPIASGTSQTISAYVRTSVIGDGTAYNGNRARLMARANPAIGINTDTVIDTATVSSDGAWEQLTGTLSSASENGAVAVYVDCDGTQGWVNVDRWGT